MLRIACADVTRVMVRRSRDATLIVQPRVGDRDWIIAQAAALLTNEEVCIIRAVMGARAGHMEDITEQAPEVTCPCFVPVALRCPVADWTCPLHAPVMV